MRIENIQNKAGDRCYELAVIGTEAQVEEFHEFTSFESDFVEDQGNGNFSITIMTKWACNKKEFRQELTQELKEFISL